LCLLYSYLTLSVAVDPFFTKGSDKYNETVPILQKQDI
jgi:hypothetical protein